ncbi:MAG: hypothetical protein ACTSX9_05280 [Candidatus Njordarchaeales archaeon]
MMREHYGLKYTIISVRREIVVELNNVMRELGMRSLGETIMELIKIYRKMRVRNFVEKVKKIREKGLDDVKEEILKVRKLRWARL